MQDKRQVAQGGDRTQDGNRKESRKNQILFQRPDNRLRRVTVFCCRINNVDRQFKSGQNLISELGVAPGETVLDVGSGTGLLAEFTADTVGITGAVMGIDPLPLRVELATRRSRSNLNFAVGDAKDLSSFPRASFDVVYLNAVFHWLHEKITPLRQFNRVLKAGGRLGITPRLSTFSATC